MESIRRTWLNKIIQILVVQIVAFPKRFIVLKPNTFKVIGFSYPPNYSYFWAYDFADFANSVHDSIVLPSGWQQKKRLRIRIRTDIFIIQIRST